MTSEDRELCERADNLSDMIRDYGGNVPPRDCLEAADLLLEAACRIEELSAYAEQEEVEREDTINPIDRKVQNYLGPIEYIMSRLDVDALLASKILEDSLRWG